MYSKDKSYVSLFLLYSLAHVVIGPPSLPVALYTSNNSIMIIWNPPAVYHAHNISDPDSVDKTTKVDVSKHPGAYVAQQVNATATEGDDTEEQTDAEAAAGTSEQGILYTMCVC